MQNTLYGFEAMCLPLLLIPNLLMLASMPDLDLLLLVFELWNGSGSKIDWQGQDGSITQMYQDSMNRGAPNWMGRRTPFVTIAGGGMHSLDSIIFV